MCIPGLDPVTLAGIAASLGGSVINSNITNDAISEQNRQNQRTMEIERTAAEAERGRQRDFELSQAEAATRALFEADGGDIAESVEESATAPTNEIANVPADYNTTTLQGQVQDGVVSDQIGRIIQDALTGTQGILGGQARISGQNSAFMNLRDKLMEMSSEIQNVGQARRGSLMANQLETSIPAATVTPSDSPIGDLLMLGGQALAGYGGQRVGARAPAARPNGIFGTPITDTRFGGIY